MAMFCIGSAFKHRWKPAYFVHVNIAVFSLPGERGCIYSCFGVTIVCILPCTNDGVASSVSLELLVYVVFIIINTGTMKT